MTLEKLVIPIIGLFASVVVYAMDWQREQDQKLSDLNILIEKQKVLLELQVQYNMLQVDKERLIVPTATTTQPIGENNGRSD